MTYILEKCRKCNTLPDLNHTYGDDPITMMLGGLYYYFCKNCNFRSDTFSSMEHHTAVIKNWNDKQKNIPIELDTSNIINFNDYLKNKNGSHKWDVKK